MGKDKQRQMPLSDRWIKALLDAPMGGADSGSIVAALEQAQKSLKQVVARARVFLIQSPLTPLVAQAAAQEQGLSGSARISMDELGNVLLAVVGSKGRTALPTLEELRARAQQAGVDISTCGRSRHKILKALKASRVPAVAPTPTPKKMIKMAPAIGPVVVISYPVGTDLSPDLLETKEPSAPDPAPAPPPRKSKLRLAEKDVDSIDLNAILEDVPVH